MSQTTKWNATNISDVRLNEQTVFWGTTDPTSGLVTNSYFLNTTTNILKQNTGTEAAPIWTTRLQSGSTVTITNVANSATQTTTSTTYVDITTITVTLGTKTYTAICSTLSHISTTIAGANFRLLQGVTEKDTRYHRHDVAQDIWLNVVLIASGTGASDVLKAQMLVSAAATLTLYGTAGETRMVVTEY